MTTAEKQITGFEISHDRIRVTPPEAQVAQVQEQARKFEWNAQWSNNESLAHLISESVRNVLYNTRHVDDAIINPLQLNEVKVYSKESALSKTAV